MGSTPAPPPPSSPPPPGTTPTPFPRNLTLIEILGYAGSAVALVGTGGALGTDVSQGVSAVVALVVAVVAFGAGFVLGAPAVDQLRRMKSVLWLLSVFGVLQFMTTIIGDDGGRGTAFLALAITCAVATALWVLLPRTLQQIAMYGTGLGAIFVLVFPDPAGFLFGGPPSLTGVFVVSLIAGAVWFGLGWKGWMRPPRTAMVLGTLTILQSPAFLFRDTELATFLILVLSIGLLVIGETVSDRAISGIAIVGVIIGGLAFPASFLDRTGGALLALLIGLAMLAGALVLARSEGHVRTDLPIGGSPPPPPPPSEPPTDRGFDSG